MTRALDDLFGRLNADPSLAPAATSMDSEIRADLLEFLIFLAGGSPVYDGLPVSKMLSPLCPTNEAFDDFVDHVATSMIGTERPVRIEADLRLMLEHIRPHVVDRNPDRFMSSADGNAVA